MLALPRRKQIQAKLLHMRDRVFSDPDRQIVDFAFDEEVVSVFPDMIRRSVPGYETMIPVTGLIAARHLGDAGLAYDLGCSLGATTLAILTNSAAPDIRVIGVDNANAMIEQARTLISDPRAHFVEADILEQSVEHADVVVLNLVLQFIDPAERASLLRRLHNEMNRGGMLLLSEKVASDDVSRHQFFDDTHLAWKRANGYSELEVSAKREALENVMRIDSEEAHVARLEGAGFSGVTQWYRCLNWASFIAFV